MIMFRVMGLLLGTVQVRVKSSFPEKFINLSLVHGIRMWNIRVFNDGIRFETDTFSYRKLWAIHHTIGCHMITEGRSGLGEVLRTLRRRKLLLFGFFCFWLTIWYVGGMIWSIEINGLERLDPNQVRERLEILGISRHVRYSELDFREIEKELSISFPEIAWVAIDRRGTYVKIRIVEKDPDPIQGSTAIDIVAAYDGIITEMLVLQGQALVEPGMTVIKGDRLIAGYKTDKGLVNAAGSVQGISWFEGYGECGIEEVSFKLTGREQKISYLVIGGKILKFRGRAPQYQSYEVDEGREASDYLPGLTVVTRIFRETEAHISHYTSEQALEIATERAMLAAHQQFPSEAEIKKSETFRVPVTGEELFRIRVRLEIELDLGTENIYKGE